MDKKICDILHCAEFYNLNACQDYKLYKILHTTRNKRRIIKNDLKSINAILGTNIESSKLDILSKDVYNIYNNQKYTPRVVDELFDLIQGDDEDDSNV